MHVLDELIRKMTAARKRGELAAMPVSGGQIALSDGQGENRLKRPSSRTEPDPELARQASFFPE